MKVVSKQITNQLRCSCGIILEYEDSDVIHSGNLNYIICPQCNEKMSVDPLTFIDLKRYIRIMKDPLIQSLYDRTRN